MSLTRNSRKQTLLLDVESLINRRSVNPPYELTNEGFTLHAIRVYIYTHCCILFVCVVEYYHLQSI